MAALSLYFDSWFLEAGDRHFDVVNVEFDEFFISLGQGQPELRNEVYPVSGCALNGDAKNVFVESDCSGKVINVNEDVSVTNVDCVCSALFRCHDPC